MPLAKKNSTAIKEKDGRKNNGKKPGSAPPVLVAKMTPAQVNKAKKDRMRVHSLNALIQEFGSEEDFWLFVANKARSSMSHLDFIAKYAFPNPAEMSGANEKSSKVININFVSSSPAQIEETTIEQEYEEADND
jgi:hypothetical protein